MSFASDKLYNGFLRRKMPAIVTRVKVREIIIHLPCLTTHDRENIEAKREICGNFDGMVLLLECLRRRENWPEQFIEALEACEHSTIAAEIRAEYDALRGVNNSNSSSPSTNVTRAHVHPAPSASHPSTPENGGNTQAAVAPPAEASAPPEPAARASPPLENPPHPEAQNAAAQAPEAVSPPEPDPEPPQSTQGEVAPAPSTPPPSPETPHVPAGTPPPSPPTPPPQREVHAHQEPEENSESDIQDVCVDNGVIPDQVSEEESEVSVNPVATPPLSRPLEQCETDTVTYPDPPQITATAEARPPQSPSPAQANPDVTDGSSFPTLTPERPPVQDTNPPEVKVLTLAPEPEETSETPTAQVVESSPQTETAATTSPLPGAAGVDASIVDDNTLCLSKPGQLVSIAPENHDIPVIPAHNPPAEPYSGDSQRLEISDAPPDVVTLVQVPACTRNPDTANTMDSVSGLPCQENGIALDHNEPEENHYESPSQSLDMQQVEVNVVHVSEEPSILNLDGQTSAPQAQIINGEAAREIPPSPPSSTAATTEAVSSLNTPSGESCHPSEPAAADITPDITLKTLPDSEEKTASHTLPANTKYILTAAGVGAFALLMAWRFKN